MKKLMIYSFLFLLFLSGSCSRDFVPDQDSKEAGPLKSAIVAPLNPGMAKLKIAVMPGLNYLDPSLMVACLDEGTDFRNNNTTYHMLVEFSKPILDEAVSQILKEKPDLLFIPGDLTYCGEKISHEAIAERLEEIAEQGIKVFVIPGNQDIDSPSSLAYNGSGSSPTPTVSRSEFETIYADFGFQDAISRDPYSLSYVAQPFENVWILGIDACMYELNYVDPYSGQIGPTIWARIKPETLEWILDRLAEAKEHNIFVYAMVHHSLTEDYTGMITSAPYYVIQNHTVVENALANAKLKVIFTAHANDITMNSTGENVLFDIGTLSLLIPPFSFRMIDFNPDSILQIKTKYITSVEATIPGGIKFLDYSENYLLTNLTHRLIGVLKRMFNMSEDLANYYAPFCAEALAAYYAGNEEFPPDVEKLSQDWPLMLKNILKSMYTDLPPFDGPLNLDLKQNPE